MQTFEAVGPTILVFIEHFGTNHTIQCAGTFYGCLIITNTVTMSISSNHT